MSKTITLIPVKNTFNVYNRDNFEGYNQNFQHALRGTHHSFLEIYFANQVFIMDTHNSANRLLYGRYLMKTLLGMV